LHYLAARGCLTAIIIFAALAGECGAQPNSPGADQKANSEQSAASKSRAAPAIKQPQAVPITEQQKPDSPAYDPHCENPKNHEDADLCEQRRMSQAAIDAVWWASFQSKLGILGFVAVLLSLFFTGWAAKAAADAAKFAERAVHSDRAWLHFHAAQIAEVTEKLVVDGVSYTEGLVILLHFKNSGRSPATHAVAWREALSTAFDATNYRFEEVDPNTLRGTVFVPPEGTFHAMVTIVGNDLETFLNRKTKFSAHTVLTYRDVFTSDYHVSEARIEFKFNGHVSHPDGVNEINLSTRVLSQVAT
jgi:hypothetical protein